MPLTLNDTFKSVEITGAIATVGGLTLADSHTTMTFSVNYRTTSAEASDFYNTEYYSCMYDSSGSDIVTQAYSYLQTLSKFSSAVES